MISRTTWPPEVTLNSTSPWSPSAPDHLPCRVLTRSMSTARCSLVASPAALGAAPSLVVATDLLPAHPARRTNDRTAMTERAIWNLLVRGPPAFRRGLWRTGRTVYPLTLLPSGVRYVQANSD